MKNKEIELERTFLAKCIPRNIYGCPFIVIEDKYIPAKEKHPILRIRRKGNKFVITKKYRKVPEDPSTMVEETIILNEREYKALSQLENKGFAKQRFMYTYKPDHMCEFDIYQDALKGLVVIDFEFQTQEEKESFAPPDFCLVEITAQEFLAGGMLCGKKYEDLEPELIKLEYKKLI